MNLIILEKLFNRKKSKSSPMGSTAMERKESYGDVSNEPFMTSIGAQCETIRMRLSRPIYEELPPVTEVDKGTIILVYDEYEERYVEYCVINGAWERAVYRDNDQEEQRPLEQIISEQIERQLKQKEDSAMKIMERLREYRKKMQTKSDNPLIPLVCTQCGSPLKYNKGVDTIKCEFCDTEYLIN